MALWPLRPILTQRNRASHKDRDMGVLHPKVKPYSNCPTRQDKRRSGGERVNAGADLVKAWGVEMRQGLLYLLGHR